MQLQSEMVPPIGYQLIADQEEFLEPHDMLWDSVNRCWIFAGLRQGKKYNLTPVSDFKAVARRLPWFVEQDDVSWDIYAPMPIYAVPKGLPRVFLQKEMLKP